METDKVWGMMAGLPPKPYMVISNDAYENMTKDELQWVLLHEVGHWVLGHNIKMILVQAVFILIGFFILQYIHVYQWLLAVFLGILLAAIHTQVARLFEYEANSYALSRMDHPKNLESILERATNRWRNKGKKDGIKEKLFNVWILDIYKDLVAKAKVA
jgi:Zn-dependent protease with chaperone function